MVRSKRGISESSWRDWMEFFILNRKSQGLAKRTLEDYEYHIKHFFEETKADIRDQSGLKLSVIKYFANSTELSPATFNTRRKCLKPFFDWAMGEGFIQVNPIAGIRKRKEDEKPRSVNEEVLKRLLTLPNQKLYSGLRDYALLLLTMDTGIRPSEAFGLTFSDFSFKSMEVTIPAHIAKTRVSRCLPLSPVTVEAISRLIRSRDTGWKDDVPVFCTDGGNFLNRSTWGRRLRQYSTQLGVKVQPYALRHSFAVIFLRLGGNAFALQRELGHTTLTMTKRYVALTEGDLNKQHNIASPLNILAVCKRRVRRTKE